MLGEIFSLGFDRVELGHGIRPSLLEGVEQFLADHPMAVTSLHNFCPLPIEIQSSAPDCYQGTSDSVAERDRARHYTLQTIDYAHRLGVHRVVMHLGSAVTRNDTERLIRSIFAGRYLDRRYVKLKLDAIRRREASAAYDRVLEWLQPVLAHAKAAGVTLGIENRIGIETFPSEREFRRLFQEIADGTIGYWHDFGHIQIKENLALLDHAEWLRQIGSRTFGCHVQDCIWPAQDHQPPFTGDVDLAKLVPLLPKDCAWVWEMSPRKSGEEIQRSVAKWKERFGG